MYEELGWYVKYSAPSWNETFDENFTFRKKVKIPGDLMFVFRMMMEIPGRKLKI